jgi:diguanylate cyclase (GGDEF)-like protein
VGFHRTLVTDHPVLMMAGLKGAIIMDLQAFLEMDEVSKYERFMELERIAFTDKMTGCKNRNWFIENRSVLETDISCAIIIDIDHFKKVNDTLGHDAGDVVLQDVAKAIMSVVRFTDTIRYGGEEFLVMLQGVSLLEACKVADRIRIAIETKTDVTASLGVSSTITNADKALYTAKESGRNKVCYM